MCKFRLGIDKGSKTSESKIILKLTYNGSDMLFKCRGSFPTSTESIILSLIISFIPIQVWALEPEIVPTFENLGISWAPVNKGVSEAAKVQYRIQGNTIWNDAQNLWFDNRGGNYVQEYRGSIVNLTPGTTYEVNLTLLPNGESVTALASTWSENFGEGIVDRPEQNITSTVTETCTVTLSASGTPEAYYVYDGEGIYTIDSRRLAKRSICIADNVHHLIIRGWKITGALDHGIHLGDNTSDIVIENNEITQWGRDHDGKTHNEEVNYRFGIGTFYYNHGGRYIVQYNRIHHPVTDANAWDQPVMNTHPAGAQGIGWHNSTGNNVIRYNDIHGDAAHMFNDAIGFGSNISPEGFPGKDSDIYGNMIAYAWDDAIEAEGGGENVRIWNNYITDTYVGIAGVVIDQGPMYAWRNIFGRSRELANASASDYYGRGYAFKLGNNLGLGGAKLYIYHNTLLQEAASAPNTHELGFNRFINNTNNGVYNVVAYNNISHTSYYTDSKPAGSHFRDITNSCTNDVNYNLYSGRIENNCIVDPHESDGGINDNPIYDQATLFQPVTNQFLQALDVNSPGYDDGIILPNFNDGYEGAGPDMGAIENNQTIILYGVSHDNQANNYCVNLIRNDFTYEVFSSVQAGINDPNAVDFDTIQIVAGDFIEDILYDRMNILIVAGGFYCSYSDNHLTSSINSLIIKAGTLIVENIVIK